MPEPEENQPHDREEHDLTEESEQHEPPAPRIQFTRFQQFAVGFIGFMLIVTGLATIFAGRLFNPYFPAGAIFGPFALAGGALIIALAIRLGKKKPPSASS